MEKNAATATVLTDAYGSFRVPMTFHQVMYAKEEGCAGRPSAHWRAA